MPYTVCREFSFAAAHRIRGHTGGCQKLHGHNYRVRVCVSADVLDDLGMVVDFAELQQATGDVVGRFDHSTINDVPPFDERNTTAELLAAYVYDGVDERLGDDRVSVVRVEVWENDASCAIYEPDR